MALESKVRFVIKPRHNTLFPNISSRIVAHMEATSILSISVCRVLCKPTFILAKMLFQALASYPSSNADPNAKATSQHFVPRALAVLLCRLRQLPCFHASIQFMLLATVALSSKSPILLHVFSQISFPLASIPCLQLECMVRASRVYSLTHFSGQIPFLCCCPFDRAKVFSDGLRKRPFFDAFYSIYTAIVMES